MAAGRESAARSAPGGGARRSPDTYSATPSVSHAGVRPDVEPASAACVSSWVTTRRRPSESSVENGWPDDDEPQRAHVRGPRGRAALDDARVGERGERLHAADRDRQRARLLGAGGDHHEVAPAQPAAREQLAHRRVAVLERDDQLVDRHLGRRQHHEVLGPALAERVDLPRRQPAAAAHRRHPPAVAGATRHAAGGRTRTCRARPRSRSPPPRGPSRGRPTRSRARPRASRRAAAVGRARRASARSRRRCAPVAVAA